MLVLQTYRFVSGAVYYGEYLHWTGEQSARLLIVTMAISALRRWFPTATWSLWLRRHRRDLGVATFAYAGLHLAAYANKLRAFRAIFEEATSLELATGWVAFIILAMLAVTSNDSALKALGANWKLLHRAVYLAAVMTFAHWVLTAFDPTAGYLHAAVLAIVLVARSLAKRRGVA